LPDHRGAAGEQVCGSGIALHFLNDPGANARPARITRVLQLHPGEALCEGCRDLVGLIGGRALVPDHRSLGACLGGELIERG